MDIGKKMGDIADIMLQYPTNLSCQDRSPLHGSRSIMAGSRVTASVNCEFTAIGFDGFFP